MTAAATDKDPENWRHKAASAVLGGFARLLKLERRQKRAMVIAVDIALCIAAVLIAFSLRVGALSFPVEPPLIFAAVAVPMFLPIFYWSGAYGTIFRFSGGRTIMLLASAIAIYALPMLAIFMIIGVPGVPRTVAFIQPILFFGFAAAARLVARHVLIDLLGAHRHAGGRKRVLIYGAGSAGQQLALSLRYDPGFALVGFVDDDKRLDRQTLDGTIVRHSSMVREVIADGAVDTVLLALPSVSRKRRRAIIDGLQGLHVHVQTLPNMTHLVDGKVSVTDLQEIRIEDLLGRDPVTPNELLLGRTIVGKSVLVTGAGGSIGSELCRQIVQIGAKRLVLFEQSEFALYAIERELLALAQELDQTVAIVPRLGSITDRERVRRVFAEFAFDTVYHAAAYKHVPLVEANPVEGVRNNVLGTFEVVDAAKASDVRDFILISTDKAVRPTNVMGASKRVAEQVVQAHAAMKTGTRFSMVRFGNVLGSSGSVVPLFRSQIAAGGPITLTDKRITRYFMTIPEAANLVIQAAGLAKGGEVFLLDMGKPVRIAELARTMVQLSGLTVRDEGHPDGDIEIREVGLRPGEKLYEELLIGADAEKTVHPRVMKAHEDFQPGVLGIIAGLRETDTDAGVIGVLSQLVDEFVHRGDNLAG